MLIEKGADLNIIGNRGDTALTWAAYKGSFDMFQMLVFNSDVICNFNFQRTRKYGVQTD